MSKFTITDKWIWRYRVSDVGGWKAAQLRHIGVYWPPPKGWRKKARGRVISLDAKKGFESFCPLVGGFGADIATAAMIDQPRLTVGDGYESALKTVESGLPWE